MAEENEGSPEEEGEEKPLPEVSPGKRDFQDSWGSYSVAYFPPSVREKIDAVADKYGYERWLTVAWAVSDLLDMDVESLAEKVAGFESQMRIKQGRAKEKGSEGGA